MTTEKNNNNMILSASAFDSCMTEFSIPDFNKTIIKNIISLFLRFLNTERREVVYAMVHLSVPRSYIQVLQRS